MKLIIVFAILCHIIQHLDGYFITVDANEEQCFFDRVTSGTKMSLMFEVAEGGFLDIDVKVSSSFYCNLQYNSKVYTFILLI